MFKVDNMGTPSKQRIFIIGLIISILTCSTLIEAQPVKEILIGSSTISFANISTYYARDRGFFLKEGLDPKIVIVKTEVALAALANGDLDYTTLTTSTIEAAVKGMPVRLIAVKSTQPVWGLVVHKDIRGINDLRGKKVGISSYGGASYAAVLYVLRYYGLEPKKDVTVLATGSTSARMAALKNRSIDGALIAAPGDLIATTVGDFKILLDVGTIYKLPMGGMSTTLLKLKESAPEVKKVVRAVVQGTRSLIDPQNKEEVIKYISTLFALDRSLAVELYRRLIPSIAPAGLIERDKIRLVIEGSVDRGVADKPIDPDKVADFSFVRDLGF
jgi:NitT/TauT family transport system substrate-binding protein